MYQREWSKYVDAYMKTTWKMGNFIYNRGYKIFPHMTTRETSIVRYSLFWERYAQYEMQYLSTWEVQSLDVRRRGQKAVNTILFDENGWIQKSDGKILRLWFVPVSSLRYDVKTGVLTVLSMGGGRFHIKPEDTRRTRDDQYLMDSFNCEFV